MSVKRAEIMTKLADVEREIGTHDFYGASLALLEKEKLTLERMLMVMNNNHIERLEKTMKEAARLIGFMTNEKIAQAVAMLRAAAPSE